MQHDDNSTTVNAVSYLDAVRQTREDDAAIRVTALKDSETGELTDAIEIRAPDDASAIVLHRSDIEQALDSIPTPD